jgi:protein TonB
MTAPRITPHDRLSMALFMTAVVHALVILGVGFTSAQPKPVKTPPLIEVTLAERPQEATPKDYDYLAQANQDGGGENRRKERPKQAANAAAVAEPDGQAAAQAAPAPAPAADRRRELVSTRGARPAPTAQASSPEQQPATAAEIISDNRQLAQAGAQRRETESLLAKYPSKRWITSRTKAHAAADYMRRWVEQVEQVGNLNYPEEARRRQLSGSLIVEVTVRPDGNIVGARVRQSSKQPVLDQAALRIIRLAAPFPAVPADVLGGDDLIVITRTLEFIDQQGLSTGD